MDYFDSEVTESLDFLSPPVKRIYRNTERERVYQPYNAFNQNNRLLRDFRTTVAKQTRAQLPALERPDGSSSTSLDLNRTTEREILERYSDLSYTNLKYSNHIEPQTINPTARERPLIKVTVIPNNSEEAQTAKLRKRRHKTRTVQSTVSNQENSIKAKNVYLVVAGRKREKIYEIKTTGSAEFPNNLNFNDEDATIEQVTHFKQLISSLNMDKKKKKAKKKDVAPKGSGTSLVKQVLEGPDPVFQNCSCLNDIQSGSPKDVRLRKSRVRICGKIGITDDDRYILKCAATVNDKPAETSNTQRSFVQCRNGRCQKDSNIQADFRNEKFKKIQEIHVMRSKETQCTQCPQDNFNTVCFSNIEKLRISSKKDQLVHCHCLKPSEDVIRYEYESETTKDSSSPLVIISVYPKQDSSEGVNNRSPVRNNTSRPSKKTNVYNITAKERVNNERQKPDNDTNKMETRPGTRSPSPLRSPTRSRFENNQGKGRSRLENNQEKTRSRLNDNQETGNIRKKIIYKESFTTNKKNTNKPEQGKPKPRQNVPQARPDNKRQTNQKYYSRQQVATGTNTDHILHKKALVDSYTHKLAAQMKQKKAMNWTAPKNDVSNVSINIDGENEFYDVLFHQGDLTTDLRVRKTVKNQGSQKGNDASLENFFSITQEEPRTSFSQMYLDEPSYQPDNLAMLDPVSRLAVRDSIEISHRREDRISICARSGRMPLSYKVYSSETNSEENRKFFAPIKHYRGDSCALANPVQRDREIRKLLGIQTGRPNTSKAIEEESMSADEDHSLHSFYQTTCDNPNFGSDVQDSMCSIYKLNPPCCCAPKGSMPTEYEQTDSNKPVDSRQSGISQQNILDQKPLPTAKKQTVSKVKDSNLPELDESKQIEQKLSKTSKKQKSISIPKDSDQSDSDDSKGKLEDSDQSDSDESKQKPDDSDQTDTEEPQKNDQKTSNSLKKRKTIKPTDSDQVDSDDSKQLKESDSDNSKQKPIDSEQSDSDEPQKIEHKTSNSPKTREITPPTDSDLTDSEDQTKSDHSLKKGKSSKLKDSDQLDSDQPRKIYHTSRHFLKREKSSKLKDSDQLDSDNPRKIYHTSRLSLKREKSSKPKDPDQSDSSDQRKIYKRTRPFLKKGKSSDPKYLNNHRKVDCKCSCSLKKGKYSKPKDKSNFNDQIKIDRSFSQSLKKRPISGKHEESEPWESVESKVNNDKFGSSAKKIQSSENKFYETDSIASKIRQKNLYKPYAVNQAPLYQQLILNRNINVYLQIEQFTKQKPIVLSRKQYDKVKKTIENASTKRTKMCICTKSSSISLGEVRKKPKTVPTRYHKSKQTEANAKLNIKELNNQDNIKKTIKEKIVKDGITEPTKNNFKEPLEQIPKEAQTEIPNLPTETPKQMSKEDSKEKAKKVSNDHSKEIAKQISKEDSKEKAIIVSNDNSKETPKQMSMVDSKKKAKKVSNDNSKETQKQISKEDSREKAKEKEKIKEMENTREKEKEKAKAKEIEKTKAKAKRKEKEKSKKGKDEKISMKCCDYCGTAQPAVPLCCKYCQKKKNRGCHNCGRPLYYITDACASYDCASYNDCYYCGLDQGKTVVLCKEKFKKPDEPVNINENSKSSGHAASSVEIRYTSVAYMKHVTFSSTKIAEKAPIPSTSNIAKKSSYHSDSLYTIFKGHRKTPTPNLGTSAYSLYSEYSDARSPEPEDLKAKKPFLKRLMSCLVMRYKASETKIGRPVPKMTSVNSSVDSYHISTSLGAIDLSSSIYDTSASFYSNHTILPMNSKMKRGFFSSVRGFLTTNRRS